MSERWKIDDGSQWSGDPEDPPVQVEPPSVYDGTGYSVVVDKVPDGASQLEEMEMLRRIAAALNAAPQAEQAREIIERAEKAIMRVASESDVSVGAGTEPGCWWCEAPAGEDHASDCFGSKLLADIAAYKEDRSV